MGEEQRTLKKRRTEYIQQLEKTAGRTDYKRDTDTARGRYEVVTRIEIGQSVNERQDLAGVILRFQEPSLVSTSVVGDVMRGSWEPT